MTRAYNINLGKNNDKMIDHLVDSLSVAHPDELNVNIITDDESVGYRLLKKSSDYSKHRQIRKTGLSKLITEKLLAGESIGRSISSSISESTKARFVGIKEKFDPLNIARAMTGGSRLAPALLGRMMGRSKEDIEYFAGTQGKGPGKGRRNTSKVSNKDPFTTNIGPSRVLPLRRDDSVADITAKLYNLLQKTHDRKIKEQEQLSSMSSKKKMEDEASHKELLSAIRAVGGGQKSGGPGGAGGVDDDDTEGWLAAAIGGWAGWKLMRGGWKAFRGLTKTIPDKIADKIWDKGKSTATRISDSRKGIRVGKDVSANKAQSLRRTMTSREIAKLEKQGIKWDAATQRFKDTKTNKFVSAEKAASKVGKSVPGATASKVTKASKTLSGAKGVLKFLRKIPILSTLAAGAIALQEISDAIEAREQGAMNDDQLHKAVTGIVGGLLGGVAGAEVGAAVGAAIGSVVPVAGTLVGGVAGGIGGFLLGEAGGKYIAEKLYDYLSNNEDAEPKSTAQPVSKTDTVTSAEVPKETPGTTVKKAKGSGVSQDMKVMGSGQASLVITPPETDTKLQTSVSENNNMKLSALTESDMGSGGGAAVINQSSINGTTGKNTISVAHTNVRNPEPSLKRSNYESAVVV